MKIVISGIGETGLYLSQILLTGGHELVLIEQNERRVRLAQERLDAKILTGDGGNPLTLEPVIDEQTDLFIATTDHDEINIIGTLIARRFGAKRAIARITNVSNLIHPLLTDDARVSVLNAEMIVAKDIARLISAPSADEIEFFANGKAEMIKLHVADNAAIANTPLKHIALPPSWILIAVVRGGEFSVATGEVALRPGDQVLAMGSPETQKDIEDLLGLHPAKVRRVVLVGYNNISAGLTQNLRSKNIEVRLLEEDEQRAETAAAELDGVLVLQGDCTSEDLLEQAGVDQADYLIALTADDETNVLISLLAKERGVRRTIALTQKPQYKPISEKVGIDTVVNPRSSMVDEIVRVIHHKDLSSLVLLEGGKGSMLEVVIDKRLRMVGKPLSKVKLPTNMLIGAIVRNDELIIPRGEDHLEVGDRIVVFSPVAALSEVKRLFGH